MVSADHNYGGSLSVRLTRIRGYRENTSFMMRRKIKPLSYVYVHGVETETLHEGIVRKKTRRMAEDPETVGGLEAGPILGAGHKDGA